MVEAGIPACESCKRRKMERRKQKGRECEDGLVVQTVCICNSEGEELLSSTPGGSPLQSIWEIV